MILASNYSGYFKSISTLLVGITVTVSPLCSSQDETTQDDLFTMSLQALLQVKVTSSTLTDKSLRSAPSSVTVFTRKQIARLGADYLHEIMNLVPGFQSFRQSESGDEYYHSVRGHRSSTSSREVLVLIDGQRFNREFDNAINAPMLALGNIEEIEFIRGPGSALYGSNAFLGVVDITTTRNKNEAQLTHGSHRNFQGQILSSGCSDLIDYHFYANGFNDRGESYSLEDAEKHSPVHSRDPRKGIDFNLLLKKDDVELNLMHFERQAHDYYAIGYTSNTYNHTQNRHSSLRYKDTLNWQNALTSTYSLRYSIDHYSAEGHQELLGASNFEQEANNLELIIRNDHVINARQSLQFGFEYHHADIDETFFVTEIFGPLQLYTSSTRDVAGIYFQYQNAISAATEFTAGLRYDRYSQIDSALSPRLGVTHQMTDVHTVKLLFGSAFRAPTINELKLEDQGFLAGNEDLDPETIETWELVWMANWQNHSVTLTLFDNTIKEGVVRDDSKLPSTFINAEDDESTQGIEVEYISELTRNWRLHTSLSYFDNLSDEDFRQSNKLATMVLNYQQSNLNLNFSVSYAGERQFLPYDATDLQSLEDYWLINSKLNYNIIDNCSFYVQIKNLLDEDYETPTQAANLLEGVPNRGRETSMGVHWTFN